MKTIILLNCTHSDNCALNIETILSVCLIVLIRVQNKQYAQHIM